MYLAALLLLLLLFLYPFFFYPPLIAVLARRRTRAQPSIAAGTGTEELPSLALVICALNEEKVLPQKLDNCLKLDYDREKLSILVISDGSTDRTAEIVRGYRDAGIQLIEQKTRRGKIANLNAVLPSRREEILVLSDANVMYHPQALRRLVARFADPAIGCVSGKVILTDSAPALDGPTRDYYSLEWSLQEHASQIYSMAGADGAMYALRRNLFQPCPADTLIEDFLIPMNIVRQGRRVVFAPEAIGWEQGAASLGEEFRRKVRIAAGAAQGLLRGNAWPRHAPPSFWFIFLSHKLLRWLSPLVGASLLLASLYALDRDVSRVVLGAFVILSAMAVVRLLSGWAHPLLSAPFYFLFGQVAVGVGLLKGLTRQQTVLWAKEDR